MLLRVENKLRAWHALLVMVLTLGMASLAGAEISSKQEGHKHSAAERPAWLDKLENQMQRRAQNSRIKLLKEVQEDLSKIVVFPWFYVCNKKRYPAWEGKHDTRVT